jgi:hypothetical protein
VWALLYPFVKVAIFLKTERQRKIDARVVEGFFQKWNRIFNPIIASRTVLNGVFKGLRYPNLEASRSALWPKLLGSYELEIQELIEQLCQKKYEYVYNIGCAEGYYAVGFALRISSAKIFAYDSDPVAMRKTRHMATLNEVQDSVIVGNFFSSNDLETIPQGRPCLILCDCEGYEKQIFTAEGIKYLSNADLLIEVHDFVDITIAASLKELFTESHDLISVKSIDDIEKAKTYKFTEAEPYNLEERKMLFAEGRPAIMEWCLFTPKQQ